MNMKALQDEEERRREVGKAQEMIKEDKKKGKKGERDGIKASRKIRARKKKKERRRGRTIDREEGTQKKDEGKRE